LDTRIKLPMPIGLLLERAKGYGFSESRLLAILNQRDHTAFPNEHNEQISWNVLFDYAAEHRFPIARALREGYTFKFITIRGLKRLLAFKFNRHPGTDYVEEEGKITGLTLTRFETDALRSLLSPQWALIIQLGEIKHGQARMKVDIVLALSVSQEV